MMARHDEIRALTTAEIGRQIKQHTDRRQQIVNERAAICASAKEHGTSETPMLDADERAAREHAKTLLNGSAPSSLSLPPEITRDRMLCREQRGIDIVLKILGDKNLAARAAEAVAWAEARSGLWRALAREIVLTAIRLDALERRAGQLLGECGDLSAVRLPMVLIVNSPSISEAHLDPSLKQMCGIPLTDLKAQALAEGVVTSAEIRKAENAS
jgi:hypothetical protein